MIDSAALDHRPLFKLKELLDAKLGAGQWAKFEPETILIEIGTDASDLIIDKISLLRILELMPALAYQDPAFFLYACEVINNEAADFEAVPHVTMLEAAYGIHSINRVLLANKVVPEYPESIVKTCAYILRQEGCSVPVEPFIFVPEAELEPGQTAEDTANKKKAVAMYLTHMDSL